MIARDDISDWKPGNHGSTFGGNPVACAAALATLELVEGGLVQNAAEVGSYLKEKLAPLRTEHPIISDVRGLGLMVGVEMQSAELRDRVVRESFENGLLLLGSGERTIRFCPPLIVSRAEVDTAVGIFAGALGK
jgi:4-aminobutyrate aminotransferase